jgi:hypothetical protein
MCFFVNDDFIDELALGRARGTKEEAHLDTCEECQERVRRRREWIAVFRNAVMPQSAGPKIQRRLPQKDRLGKLIFRLVKDGGA